MNSHIEKNSLLVFNTIEIFILIKQNDITYKPNPFNSYCIRNGLAYRQAFLSQWGMTSLGEKCCLGFIG